MPKSIPYPTILGGNWDLLLSAIYPEKHFLYKSSKVSYTVCVCSAVQLTFIMWSRYSQYSSALLILTYDSSQLTRNCCFLIWFYCFSYDTEVVEKPFSVFLIILYIDYYFEPFEQTFPQTSIFTFCMFRAIISVRNEKEV